MLVCNGNRIKAYTLIAELLLLLHLPSLHFSFTENLINFRRLARMRKKLVAGAAIQLFMAATFLCEDLENVKCHH